MIDAVATEGHFRDHLAPILAALPDAERGELITDPDATRRGPGDAALVASYGDHKRARFLGYRRIIRAEHGAGQSYAGDPVSATVPNYAGGRDADDVGLFLVPGPHPARRWQEAYPDARVAMVGSPRLDDLPRRQPDPDPRPVVALSFHFNAYIGCPEGDGAVRYYRNVIPELARRFRLIGHAHPRHAERVRPWFARAGVEFLTSFAEVCRRADVYATDNSSTLFEFAATGRPVVVLHAPVYRRTVDHGLRFWEAAHVGPMAQPATVATAIAQALEGLPSDVAARDHALGLVYAHRTGGARLAAAAITSWAA